MKNRLHKSTLKVLGFEFFEGRNILESTEENGRRRYPLRGRIQFAIHTNQGSLHVTTGAGFVFDGRSGPKIVDWYAPNLGNLYEKMCWFVHDCNGYGQDLSPFGTITQERTAAIPVNTRVVAVFLFCKNRSQVTTA